MPFTSKSVLMSHSTSGYRGNSGPLNQQITLLLLVASSPLQPSSVEFSFVDTYFHIRVFFSYMSSTRNENLELFGFILDIDKNDSNVGT